MRSRLAISSLVSLLASLVVILPTATLHGGSDTCCPTDVDGDGVVGPSDLAAVLGGWGPCTTSCSKSTLTGRVLMRTGGGVRHATIQASHLGTRLGSGVTTASGLYILDGQIDAGTSAITLTASATIEGAPSFVSKIVESIEPDGITEISDLLPLPVLTGSASWLPSLGAGNQFDNSVSGAAVFDDGSGRGPQLYVSGQFIAIGGQTIRGVARWTGSAWEQVGIINGSASGSDMVVFDDGSGVGAALYVSNHSGTGGVRRWDGSSWVALGAAADGLIRDMQIFDDGSSAGPQLYVVGDFTNIGGVPASRIAKWNGQSWSAVGSGFGASMTSLAVYDDGSGSGPELYAGGGIAGTPGSIAKWNGASWLPLGAGVNVSVWCLTTYDDGTGEALYAGGNFTTAGGQPAAGIARWKNGAWSSLGSGITGSATVRTLAATVDPVTNERSLFAGGSFTAAGGTPVSNIARWNGQAWSSLGANFDSTILRIIALDPGVASGIGGSLEGSNTLFVLGQFSTSPTGDPRFARWGNAAPPNGR